jgi:integrase/recombinase XerD
MATTPDEHYQVRQETLGKKARDGIIRTDDCRRIIELAFAYDENQLSIPTPDDESTREPGTLEGYINRLMQIAQYVHLSEADADEINRAMTKLRNGLDFKKDKRAKSTIRVLQSHCRRFYAYHDDLGVDKDDISMYDQEDTSVDPRDMLTREEIKAMKDAVEHPRDNAIVHLLLYTGMRNTALRSLRVEDIDIENGVYYLNTDASGLKNADENGGARPLLGAKAAVRDWLKYHPDPEPEHYLITGKPGYSVVDATRQVSRTTITRVMQQVDEKTDINKPLNPHALRHNFVTICKRDYEIPDETVKYLIGHSQESRVMETTYAHLSDQDHIERAEVAFGIREEQTESPLTPDVCDVCGASLDPNAKACSSCGAAFTPDAHSTQQRLQDDMKESYKQTDPEDTDTQEKIDTLDNLLDDPEVKAALLEKLGEE